jgi:hypothetical protein
MKINFIPIVIATSLAALISYGFYSLHSGENKALIGLSSFFFVLTILLMTIAVSFDSTRTTTNIRVLSSVFLLISLTSNLIFSLIDFTIPAYIVTNGIIFFVFILLVYSINKADQ